MSRRLLPFVGVILALLTPAQRASAASEGLNYTAYSWTTTPQAETQCNRGGINSLTLNFDANPIPNCPTDRFYLDITGQLYSPGPQTSYIILSDDGVRVTIDGTIVLDNWWDRGCSGYSISPQLTEGWHTIRVEYYENGGATCLELYQLGEYGWQEIPSAYLDSTTAPEPQTTTTTIETTTTAATSTTTEPPTTTTYQPTESSSIPAATSTSEVTIQTSTSTLPTLTVPAITPSTSEPIRTPDTTSTSTSSTTSIPPTITENITTEQALDAATNPDVIAELTQEEAAAVFEAINAGDVTAEEAAAIVAAVQDAPPNIRKEFEAAVNVFGGLYDNYVPLGSLVSVATRRIIIVTTGLLVATPGLRRK